MRSRRRRCAVLGTAFVGLVLIYLLGGLSNVSISHSFSSANRRREAATNLWDQLEPRDNLTLCEMKFSAYGYSSRFGLCTAWNKVDSRHQSSLACFVNSFSHSTFCEATELLINVSRIRIAPGGEPIESVLGRPEEDEMPVYSPGSFLLAGCSKLNNSRSELKFHLGQIFQAMEETKEEYLPCTSWVEEPTLFVSRYEYANLYHTMTDWYNTWITLAAVGLLETERGSSVTRPRPHRIVFLDGHAFSDLDATWKNLFTPNIAYLSTITPGTCYRRALFVAPGYTSPIYDWPDECGAHSSIRDYADYVLARHGLLDRPPVSNKSLFIFRDPHMAHPRNPGGGVGRQINNSIEVEAVMREAGGIIMHPVNLTFGEQLADVWGASVLIGVHGAGLTHVMFMRPKSTLIELQPETHLMLTHFEKFARWSGQRYVRIQLIGSAPDCSYVDPAGLRFLLNLAISDKLVGMEAISFDFPLQHASENIMDTLTNNSMQLDSASSEVVTRKFAQ